jgi:histidinol-phosphate aminotransferase
MSISRRALLRRIAAGAAAGTVFPSLAHASHGTGAGELFLRDGAAAPVRLHLGENGYGASPKAVAAIRGLGSDVASRYPDASERALRARIAEVHHIEEDRVVVGCGSRDILRAAAVVFADPGTRTIVAQPTFGFMSEVGRAAGTQIVGVPLRSDYAHDLEAMLSSAEGAPGLFYICNPNNPTGSLTRRADIEAFLAKAPGNARVLIDEAYHHYVGGSSDYASFIDRPVDDPRVIVVRSFSAIHGLAGLRVGYAVASRQAAGALDAARLPDGVNAIAAIAAMAAMADTEHVRVSARRNADERQEFCNQANARMLRTIDSQANFVMLNVGRPAAGMIEHFRKHGVLVGGPFPTFDKYIRVSIGTPADMDAFWRVWDLLPPMHAMTM